jgi:hypothetical protein
MNDADIFSATEFGQFCWFRLFSIGVKVLINLDMLSFSLFLIFFSHPVDTRKSNRCCEMLLIAVLRFGFIYLHLDLFF